MADDAFKPLGVEGYQWYGVGGYGSEGATGYVWEEWHHELQGTRGVRFYREMRDNDVTLGAGLLVVQQFLRGVPWKEVPASNHPEAVAWARWLKTVFTDMDAPWIDKVSEFISMIWFGWDLHEITLKRRVGEVTADQVLAEKPALSKAAAIQEARLRSSRYDDGTIGWAELAQRAQETMDSWELDPISGYPIGMWQRAAPHYQRVLIPLSKCVHVRTDTNKGNPEGRSYFRNGAITYRGLKRLEEYEGSGFERDLAGTILMRFPPGMLAEDASAEVKAAVRKHMEVGAKAKRNQMMAIGFPSKMDPLTGKDTGYDIGSLFQGGREPLDPHQAIIRKKQDLAMLLNTQFQRVGMDKAGARATSTDMLDALAMGLGAVLDIIEEAINQKLDQLQAMNGVPVELRARWEHDQVRRPDAEAYARAIGLLTNPANPVINPDKPLEDYSRQIVGAPPRENKDQEDAEAFAGDINGPHAHSPGEGVAARTQPRGVPDAEAIRRERRAAAAEAKAHGGTMVALFVPAAEASRLAVPGGEPAGDLHVTLAFLGHEGDSSETAARIRAVVAGVAAQSASIAGRVGGIGTFAADAGTDGKDVVFAIPDVPGLAALRERLRAALDGAGFMVERGHGFAPHVTLAYLDPTAARPVITPPPVALRFTEITLAVGARRESFPLAGTL